MKNIQNITTKVLRQVIIMTLCYISFTNVTKAQSKGSIKSADAFIEWNAGLALIEDIGGVAPGTSLLYGVTFINENNFIIEAEAGLAFPSVATAKVGVGKKINNMKNIVGVRPFPFNIYFQTSFPAREKGYWIASMEFNPLDNKHFLSVESRAILNFGYRWNLKGGF